MSKTLSTENVMFLLDVRQFKSLNSKALRALLGREIFDNFVANNSRYQVRALLVGMSASVCWALLRSRLQHAVLALASSELSALFACYSLSVVPVGESPGSDAAQHRVAAHQQAVRRHNVRRGCARGE